MAPIDEVMRSGHLQRFGHVQRRDVNRHPQSDEPDSTGSDSTGYQMRALQEDIAPTDEGRHDGHGCYSGYGPRPGGVEKEDKADP